MSKTVVLPNGLEVSFPENATLAEMNRAIGRYMASSNKEEVVEEVAEAPKGTGKFFKSIPRGIDNVQASFGSFLDAVGEASGLEGLEAYGEKVVQKNEEQLAAREKVDPRLALKDVNNIVVGKQSWVDYIQQSLGEVLPSMGLSLGGGFAGAKAGAGIANVLTGPLVPLKVVGVPLGAAIGAGIGAFLPSAVLGTGEVQSTIKELDPNAENPWAALGGGAVIGALDVAALSVPVLASLKKGIPKDTILKGLINNGVTESIAKGSIGTATRALTKAARLKFPRGRKGKALAIGTLGAGSEGLTERLQELTAIEIAEAVTDKEVMNRAERLLEATVMGVIAGAGFGGVTGAATGRNYDPARDIKILRDPEDNIILGLDADLGELFMSPYNPLVTQQQAAIDASLKDVSTVTEEGQRPDEPDDQAIAQESVRIQEEDLKNLSNQVNKKPVEYMKAVVTSDFNYNNKENKLQTYDSFRERFGLSDPEDSQTASSIFTSLIDKGFIERKGVKWKYTDKSLNNKDLKAVQGQDLKALQSEKKTKGNKDTYNFRVGDKEFIATKEVRNRKEEGKPIKSKLVFSNVTQKGFFPEFVAKDSYQGFDYKIQAQPYNNDLREMGGNSLTSAEADTRKIKNQKTDSYGSITDFGTPEKTRNVLYIKESNSDGPYLKVSPLEYGDRHSKNQIRDWILEQHEQKKDIFAVQPRESKRDFESRMGYEIELKDLPRGQPKTMPVSQARDVGPLQNVQASRWTVRGKGNKNRIKTLRNDKKFSIQPQTDEQQLAGIRESIIDFVDVEFPGRRAQDKLSNLPYPVGVSLQLQFKIDSLNSGIRNRKDRAYSSPQEMLDDITLYNGEILDINDRIISKKEARKNYRLLKEKDAVKIVDQEIISLGEELETKQELVKQLDDFINRDVPTSSAFGRYPTRDEIKKILTKPEKKNIKQDTDILENAEKAATVDGTGGINPKANRSQSKIFAEYNEKDGPQELVTSKEKLEGGLANISLYPKWFNSQQYLADKFSAYRPLHKLLRKYDETFRGIVNKSMVMASAYAGLNSTQRRQADKLIQAAKTIGVAPTYNPDGSLTLSIPNIFSYRDYGKVRSAPTDEFPNGEILTDTQEIIDRVEAAPERYTKEYFQDALDKSQGGKSFNEKMYGLEVGDTIVINDVATANSVKAIYQSLDFLWNNYTRAIINGWGRIERLGVSDPNLFETLEKEVAINIEQNAKNNNADVNQEPLPTTMAGVVRQRAELLSSQTESVAQLDLKEEYEGLANMIEDMEAKQKSGYFPSVREGDGYISIRKKIRDPQTGEVVLNKKGEPEYETVFRREVVVPAYSRVLYKNNFKRSAKKYVDKHMPNWKNDYQKVNPNTGQLEFDEDVELIYKGHSEGTDADQIDVGLESIERLILEQDRLLNNMDEAGRKEFEDRLRNNIKAYNTNLKMRSFQRHTTYSRGIAGYITPENMEVYVGEAMGLYTVKAGRLVARLNTESDIRDELRVLEKRKELTDERPAFGILGGESLADTGKAAAKFVFSPTSAMSFFKTVAFNGFLGGNISSLMVNLSQNFVTASFLYGAYGLKGRGTVLKSFSDAGRMIKNIIWNPQEFMIPALPEKGKPRSEWTPSEVRGNELYSKWKKFVTEEEYTIMSMQMAEGTFGKMNTEAIANNADVTSTFMKEKVIGDSIPTEAANIITKRTGQLSRFLTSMYAGGEMINRMTASLAGIRLAKKFGTQELITFADGIPGQERLSEVRQGSLEELKAAGTTVSNSTQFNLDPYNRARAMRLVGGVPLQFLGFVTMMIEIYGNALFGRYGDQQLPFVDNAQRQRMLIALVGQQMALGGLFAFPFVDDLDDIVRLLSKSLGLPVTSVYETLNEVLVDDAGLDPDTAAALLRGPLEGYGPISIGKRIALSPFQNLLNMQTRNIFQVPFKLIGGPSASFIEGWSENVFGNIAQGNYFKAALYFPPTAMTTNLVNAYYNSTEGVFTGTGRQLDDGLDGMDRLWNAIGFTTTTVSKSREQTQRNKWMGSRMSAIRDKYVDRITKKVLMSYREEDEDKKRKLMNEVSDYFREIIEHDAGKDPEDKIDPSNTIQTSVHSRLRQAYSNLPGAISPVSKPLRQRSIELNR
tara:strand:- start:504 stop:6830 length:6327 start_codon:yes stop_codon:yes gene_type:complete